MSVAIRESSIPSEHEMMVYQTMAEQAVSSKMYKGIGEKSGVMMIMLSARELRIPAMQALNGGLNIINGKVEISARMMGALIRKAGHKVSIEESSETICTLVGRRWDTDESQSASFTITEAQRAGLIKPGGGWTKWPKDMLYARALSRLSRQLFQDVIGIGYVEGEIKETDMEIIPFPQEEREDMEKKIEDTLILQNQKTELAELFAPEDKETLKQYIEVVMKHFSWSEGDTLMHFMKDPVATKEKFNSWKEKHGKA
jgi:hypothetical protein